MKKIFLSALVAAAAFFGASNAQAQISVNFSTEPMTPEIAALAQQVFDQQANPEAANKTFGKLMGKIKKDKVQATAVGKFFLDKNIYPLANQCANAAYAADHTYEPGLLLGVGVKLLRKNYGEAGAKLDEILQNNPDNIEALRLSARVYKYVNPYAAKDILLQILEKEPENLDAQKQLGDIAYQLEEYKDACEAYGKFFAKTPNPTINELLAGENYLLALMNQADFYTMKDMVAVLEPLVDEKDIVIPRMKFIAQMETFDYAGAAESVKYISEKRFADTLYVDLDYVYAATYANEIAEDLPLAIEYQKARIALDGTKPQPYKEVAQLYRRLKTPAEGLPYYKKHIETLGEKADEADKLGLGIYYTAVKDAIADIVNEDGTTTVNSEAKLALIKEADPLFAEYMEVLPDKYQGAYYRAALWIVDKNAGEDAPKAWYEKTLEVIQGLEAAEQEKAVTVKKTCLTYLMVYYLKNNNDELCKKYMQDILAIDPEHKLAKQIQQVLG